MKILLYVYPTYATRVCGIRPMVMSKIATLLRLKEHTVDIGAPNSWASYDKVIAHEPSMLGGTFRYDEAETQIFRQLLDDYEGEFSLLLDDCSTEATGHGFPYDSITLLHPGMVPASTTWRLPNKRSFVPYAAANLTPLPLCHGSGRYDVYYGGYSKPARAIRLAELFGSDKFLSATKGIQLSLGANCSHTDLPLVPVIQQEHWARHLRSISTVHMYLGDADRRYWAGHRLFELALSGRLMAWDATAHAPGYMPAVTGVANANQLADLVYLVSEAPAKQLQAIYDEQIACAMRLAQDMINAYLESDDCSIT